MMIRRSIFVLAGAIVGALLTAVPAQAVELASCGGTEIVGFTPGLRLFETQTVDMSADGQFFVCETTEAGLTSAEYETVIQDMPGMSCLGLLEAKEDATTLHWNTEDFSHFSFQVQAEVVGGVMVITYEGVIDLGLFAGAFATIEVVAAEPVPLDCLTPGGLTQSSGFTTLTITLPS
jgi:hypothetical protein